jgi:glycosyltransferase involved in cell wall biosynthesis
MRIALVVTGGVDESARERVIPLLLAFIERQAARHEVHVYVLRYHERPRTYSLLGATVHDLGRPEGIRRQYAALARAVRQHGPFDVIHGYWALPAGLTAVLVGRRLGIPSVVTLASGELVSMPDIHYGLQQRPKQRIAVAATLRLASRLTVSSQYMHRLARPYSANPDVIPVGIDTRQYEPPAVRRNGPPRLLHVASLNRVKDQPTLLAAFRDVVEQVPDVHLDIAGEDTLGGSIQTLAAGMGLESRVSFHGLLATEALVPLYRQATLFVMSSRHEADGAVALEAAACGLPIVGTTVGYLADWSPDRAVAVPPCQPKLLAAAIVDALRDPARMATIARDARAWALAHDADWSAVQFDRLYRDLARR